MSFGLAQLSFTKTPMITSKSASSFLMKELSFVSWIAVFNSDSLCLVKSFLRPSFTKNYFTNWLKPGTSPATFLMVSSPTPLWSNSLIWSSWIYANFWASLLSWGWPSSNTAIVISFKVSSDFLDSEKLWWDTRANRSSKAPFTLPGFA